MKRLLLAAIFVFLAVLAHEKVSDAACFQNFMPCTPLSALPLSITYNCSDWTQYNNPLNCGYLAKGGDDYCNPQGGINTDGTTTLKQEEVVAAANYPGGAGGKGQRHWLGYELPDQLDPRQGSGGTGIYFNFPGPTDIYIRAYARWEAGWRWDPLYYMKFFYFARWNGTSPYFGLPNQQGVQVGDSAVEANKHVGMGTYAQGPAADQLWHGCIACGWVDMYPTGTSDGSWHAIEARFKTNTPGQSNGAVEGWIDGVKKFSDTHVNFGSGDGWSAVSIGNNAKTPGTFNHKGCHAVDYDDIVISASGPIGLLGSPPFPNAPTNLQVK